MKKKFFLMVLVAGIAGTLCAQTNTNEEKTFNIPPGSTNREFTIDLDKGNKLKIELSNLDDLDRFRNMDSVIYGLLQDLKLLKDSFADETTTKRVDYIMDDAEKRKIRVQQFKPKGSSFLVTEGEIAGLKMEQDTINFIGKTVYQAKYTLRRAFTDTRYYKVSLFVNNLGDLAAYMNGSLNKKITDLRQNVNSQWDSKGNSKVYYIKSDPEVHAKANKGYIAGGDFVALRLSVDLQNYKNYFVPSLTAGLNFVLTAKNFKREIGIQSEKHFSFAKDGGGKLKTFQDVFLTLNFAHGPIKDNDPRKESYQLFNISFSYLIKHSGNLYEKNTMRLGAGTLSLFDGKTKIQPMIYFNNLFKGVTPGLRLIQSF